MKNHIKDMGECSRGTQSTDHSVDLTRLLCQNKESNQLDKKSGEMRLDKPEENIDEITGKISTELDKMKYINSIEDIGLIKDLLEKSREPLELEKLESYSRYLRSLVGKKEQKISSIEKGIKETSSKGGENKLRKEQLKSEKDLLESDKSLLKKEMYICNQERGILLEVRMLCYNAFAKHKEIHYGKDFLGQLRALGMEFQLLKEHREVLRDLRDTQNKLRSSDLSHDQRTNLECFRKVLQDYMGVRDELDNTRYDLKLLSEKPEDQQQTVQKQKLKWENKTLENRSQALKKYSEVVKKWWEMLQTADKINHVLNNVDQANENTGLDDHSGFLKECISQLQYNKLLMGCFNDKIPERLRYSEELYHQEKVFLRYLFSCFERQSSTRPTSEVSPGTAWWCKELEECFVRQERKPDDLVRYVMFLQKGLDCLIEMYDQYKTDIEEPTGLERPLDLLNKYSQVMEYGWAMPERTYELAEGLYSKYPTNDRYKYRKTSYDLMLIFGDALQDLLGNHNKLKRPDLLPEEREYLEIQNSICEKACKIGEKQQQIY